MNRTFCQIVAIAFAWTVSVSQSADAAPMTLEAVADGFGYNGSSNSVLGGGTSNTLLIKSSGQTGNQRKSFIKFDLSSTDYDETKPATFTFVEADGINDGTLSVWGLNTGFTPGSGILGTNWSETALTWNNAPGNDIASSYLMTADMTIIGTASVLGSNPAGTEYSVLIPLLSDYLQADGTVTIGVAGSPGTGFTNVFSIASITNPDFAGPELTFSLSEPDSSPVPEPATGTVLSMAGVMALGFRKRSRRKNSTVQLSFSNAS